MRTTGSLKVILNASLVVGMKFETNNESADYLRFTTVDGIHLIRVSPDLSRLRKWSDRRPFQGKEKDLEQLHSAVDNRLRELSKRMRSEGQDHEVHVAADSGHERLGSAAGGGPDGGGGGHPPSSTAGDLSN